jgi:membrane protease YdiL (CAAX protease family)
MEPKDIKTYITEHIRSGKTKRDIHEQLSAVGWSDDEIDAAYASALIESGVPVPEEGSRGAYAKKSSAVEIVINFFSFILLGIVVFALGSLYFGIIEYFFPDALNMSEWRLRHMRETVHYSMAALIVGFPLLVVALKLWFKKFREGEGKVESKLSKWLTYLVLLVASVTIVGDLIAILNEFLQGEISVRFFLKAFTILAIAGSVFGFYFLERKKIQYKKEVSRKTFQIFGWAYLMVIILGLVLGFVAGGTPATERMRSFDEQRSSDLQQITTCINNFAGDFERLPNSLSELEKTTRTSRCAQLRDPETGDAYEYRTVATLITQGVGVIVGEFELCATFALSTQGAEVVKPVSSGGEVYVAPRGSKWSSHPAGRTCKTETVSVDIKK